MTTYFGDLPKYGCSMLEHKYFLEGDNLTGDVAVIKTGRQSFLGIYENSIFGSVDLDTIVEPINISHKFLFGQLDIGEYFLLNDMFMVKTSIYEGMYIDISKVYKKISISELGKTRVIEENRRIIHINADYIYF